jgi:haloacetate dehalogenase
VLPGFSYRRIDTRGATINLASGGSGPPLLLLHGYPQTHCMWHKQAAALAQEFTVVCADLRGYGDSSKPEGAADHANYSKREMARDMIEVMAALGHERFAIAGHDRGARVAYRLALDHPALVSRLALLDIVSTRACYEDGGMALANLYFHWYFLIQPRPLPETMIGRDPRLWLDALFGRVALAASAFSAEALAEYRRTFATAADVHAVCEDYRAGASLDLAHDRADIAAGNKIHCPVLVLWGAHGVVGRLFRPLETWRELVAEPDGAALDCGHFLPEEAPEETLRALLAFFRA